MSRSSERWATWEEVIAVCQRYEVAIGTKDCSVLAVFDAHPESTMEDPNVLTLRRHG